MPVRSKQFVEYGTELATVTLSTPPHPPGLRQSNLIEVQRVPTAWPVRNATSADQRLREYARRLLSRVIMAMLSKVNRHGIVANLGGGLLRVALSRSKKIFIRPPRRSSRKKRRATCDASGSPPAHEMPRRLLISACRHLSTRV
jgi:hypothetical protein